MREFLYIGIDSGSISLRSTEEYIYIYIYIYIYMGVVHR